MPKGPSHELALSRVPRDRGHTPRRTWQPLPSQPCGTGEALRLLLQHVHPVLHPLLSRSTQAQRHQTPGASTGARCFLPCMRPVVDLSYERVMMILVIMRQVHDFLRAHGMGHLVPLTSDWTVGTVLGVPHFLLPHEGPIRVSPEDGYEAAVTYLLLLMGRLAGRLHTHRTPLTDPPHLHLDPSCTSELQPSLRVQLHAL